ncbi:MAG: hypothetical protein ABSF71_24555 [Terriglobia bacterium]|jgi:hypothetical protein
MADLRARRTQPDAGTNDRMVSATGILRVQETWPGWPRHKGDVTMPPISRDVIEINRVSVNDSNFGKIDAFEFKEVSVFCRGYEAEKYIIKNEEITRDVIENNGDKNWHPVMLMKNKLVTTLTP